MTHKQDWSGNSKSVFSTLGSSHHSETEREVNDYYATDPKAGKMLMELEEFAHKIWEPACGQGHLSEEFKKIGHEVHSTDLIDRGYGLGGQDFLAIDNLIWGGGYHY